jgi:hypothetical protein
MMVELKDKARVGKFDFNVNEVKGMPGTHPQGEVFT